MKNIQQSILEAMRSIAKTGIAKLHKASLGGATVNYRGIEQAMNEMSVILIQCGITVTPEYSDLSIIDRVKGDPKDAKATRFATVRGVFTFQAEDSSRVQCTCYGEAMDSGDKAVTKAQSVAFRTALFQQFVIPTMAMDPEDGGDGHEGAPDSALAAAERGLSAYQAYWSQLSAADKKALEPHHKELKAIAVEADKQTAGAQ